MQFGNPLKFGFPNDSLCDVITLGNSLLRYMEFLSLYLDIFEFSIKWKAEVSYIIAFNMYLRILFP